MSDEEDLSVKLEGLLGEITKVMESRKERIMELRAEIDRIENENAALENTIGTILSSFDSWKFEDILSIWLTSPRSLQFAGNINYNLSGLRCHTLGEAEKFCTVWAQSKNASI